MTYTIRMMTGAVLAWIDRTFGGMSSRVYHRNRYQR
jgi:hypothetical protein